MNKNNKLSWDLTPRQLCDLEMLLSGAFAPLKGFLNQLDYDCVVESMRLANGTLWPMPITLDVYSSFAEKVQLGETIELRDPEGVLLAHLQIESSWIPNKALEAEKVFGSNDLLHPGVYYLHHKAGSVYLGGTIEAVELPQHYDYRQHRHTPAELKALFKKLGWHKVVAFQTRNPMHRAHQELTFRAARELEANLLLHPVVGMTKPGDIDHFTRVRCYEQLIKHYPEQTTFLSLLHLAMRMAGPREAVWHALIRKNYGCTHFIIGRDHAGPGKNSLGQDLYAPYAAQDLAKQFEAEMGIQIISFENMVYVQDRAEYLAESEVAPGEVVLNISGTEFRRRLREGLEI
ncbi:MAG TPA: sulfate adenylyltransferase, partial [Thiolinea sp.]|nr:sulfate adenylyltransferase [Thiolinea sp.]